MVVEVSVVVSADSSVSLLPLIGSLDNQTMTTDRFELVIVDAGLDERQRTSLQRIAERRPNVRLVEGEAGWPDSLAAQVLVAQPNQKYFPEALERLTAFAAEHGLDAVAGRVVRPRHQLAGPFLRDDPSVEGAARTTALSSSVLLTTHDRLSVGPAGGAQLEGARVGVLASYPSADEPAPADTASPAAKITIDSVNLEWEDGALVVALLGGMSTAATPDWSPVVIARQIGTHLSFIVPSVGQVTSPPDTDGGSRWSCTARLSPDAAAAGSALAPGLWEFDAVLSGSGGASAPATVRSDPSRPALLNGVAVTSGVSGTGALQLDVTSTRFPLVVDADPAQALVTESARGVVLEVKLPTIHVHGDGTLSGLIGIGRLKTPAVVGADDGMAVFRAFVSGLVGTIPISAQFGRSGMTATGLALDISGTGQMVAVKKRPDEPKAPVKPAAAAKRPPTTAKPKVVKPVASGPVASLRRALPSQLEPVARKLRSSPVAREAYRRLTGLSR